MVPFGLAERPARRTSARCSRGCGRASAPTTGCCSGAAASGAGWTRSRRSGPSSGWPPEGRPVHLFFLGVERPGADRARRPVGAEQAHRLRARARPRGALRALQRGLDPVRGARQLPAARPTSGISAHHDHLEARFSFRTRVLDYLWAGLPMVLTRGDSMADLAERRGLGRTVDPEDDAGFAAACARCWTTASCWRPRAGRVREVAPSFRWEEAARPLIEYCARPPRAARCRAGIRRRWRWPPTASTRASWPTRSPTRAAGRGRAADGPQRGPRARHGA